MAIKLTLDDRELDAAIKAHLASKIPTADIDTVKLNIVAARQPNGPYAEVEFEFQGAEVIAEKAKPVATKRRAAVSKTVEVTPEPESTVEAEDTAPFETEEDVVDLDAELQSTAEEDAADDLAEDEVAVEEADVSSEEAEADVEETTTKRKPLFGKKK